MEDMQQKYVQFQALHQQIEQIQDQAAQINQRHHELAASKEALQGIRDSKERAEILAPVANGIFMKVHLQDKQNLLVNVGANTVVEKSVPEVIKLLETQEQELTMKMIESQSFMEELQQKAVKLYEEIENVRETKG
jgi:prefoldin alpha subunit